MKQVTIKTSLLFMLLVSITLLSISCKDKETSGCTDPAAENYDADADNDDGTCTYAREKFLGTYNANENCDSGNWTYSSTISESSSSIDMIIISDFGDWNQNVKATINGDNVTINDIQGGISFSGSGNINGNTLTIIYSATGSGFIDNCTSTYIKQ